MGAVTDVVRRHVPASYRALISVTNSYYSATDLQLLAEFVQYRLFATVPGATQEAAVWTDRKKLELLGILTTLQFIPAAIDYWGDQIASQALTGTSESNAWFDRREELWNVYDKLVAEANALAGEVGVLSGLPSLMPKISYGDNGREILITPDPAAWPRFNEAQSIYDTLIWDVAD